MNPTLANDIGSLNNTIPKMPAPKAPTDLKKTSDNENNPLDDLREKMTSPFLMFVATLNFLSIIT